MKNWRDGNPVTSNIIKKLILHSVHKRVTLYNNDFAKLFFLSKETSKCHQSFFCHLFLHRRVEAEKLDEILDSHCNLSQAIQILSNNPYEIISLTVSEE